MKAPEPTGDSAKSLEIPEVRSRATTVAADAAAIMTPYRVIDTKTVAPIFALIAHSFEYSCPAPKHHVHEDRKDQREGEHSGIENQLQE